VFVAFVSFSSRPICAQSVVDATPTRSPVLLYLYRPAPESLRQSNARFRRRQNEARALYQPSNALQNHFRVFTSLREIFSKTEVDRMLKENELAAVIVDVAYHIHRQLGPGLLESVYHAIMKYELEKRRLRVLSKEPIPLVWEEVQLPLAFEADLIVEDVVVVELKSVEQMARVYKKQLLTYLRLTNSRLGLLINFGEVYISDGISRIVNGLPPDA
jgi:GxxExxY protein